ncbi:MAG: hypothetical protein JWQ99_2759 [Blastococcus sp.]|nr:hypothetical protein [Blastococcus sp.]
MVTRREDGVDGSWRVHLDVHEPVPGRTVVLEMTAALTRLPPSEPFAPGTAWERALGEA